MNAWLIAAAALNAIASLMHAAIIAGGASWYRFFGAGERMASAAAAGKLYPTVVTSGIAAVLALWAAYALSGAGAIARLPFAPLCLSLITAVYLLRGLVLVPLWLFARDTLDAFTVWSSLICIGYGVVHLLGLTQVWARL
ncbi:hypothetical protein [Janthinobacterium fluminis]|uniref:MAPEG family protein n=1 Tax=Janthinobacterium fluminis TaxID=2987524 RepID=A0ABT5K8P1_9BURK|nr:hypothetical protein [Janthinobacterium fluminis]MDC8760152.1 hypothetical protein [Janthinobacterium fluminis]